MWTIRPWMPTEEDAFRFYAVMRAAAPQIPLAPPENTLGIITGRTQGIEDGRFLMMDGKRPIGAVALSILENPSVARIWGGVHPIAHGTGAGRALLLKIASVAHRHGCRYLRAQWFQSDQRACRFLKRAQFEVRDRVHWSELSVSSSLPDFALKKAEEAREQGIRIVSGVEVENIREDWEHAWWRLIMDAGRDIPREIRSEEMPFEMFRAFLDPPHGDRNSTRIAVKENRLVGVLNLNLPKGGKFNIQNTAVVSDLRRMGISTALKVAAVRYVRDQGGTHLVTQNHERNPMLQLNRAFGFRPVEIHLDGLKSLGVGNGAQ